MNEKQKFINNLREILLDKETETKVEETVETKETKEVKFKEIKGKGRTYQISDDAEFGEGVEIADEEGKLLAEGEYELEDGTKFSVDSEGKVVSIEKVEEEKDEEMETKTENKEDSLETKINKLTELVQKLVGETKELEKEKEIMNEKIIKLSKSPAEEEVTIEKSGWELRKEKRLNSTDKMIESIRKFRK